MATAFIQFREGKKSSRKSISMMDRMKIVQFRREQWNYRNPSRFLFAFVKFYIWWQECWLRRSEFNMKSKSKHIHIIHWRNICFSLHANAFNEGFKMWNKLLLVLKVHEIMAAKLQSTTNGKQTYSFAQSSQRAQQLELYYYQEKPLALKANDQTSQRSQTCSCSK